MRYLFCLFRDFVREYVISGDFPKWASPFVNALDPVYHDQLQMRLEILNAQVDVLEREIAIKTNKA